MVYHSYHVKWGSLYHEDQLGQHNRVYCRGYGFKCLVSSPLSIRRRFFIHLVRNV